MSYTRQSNTRLIVLREKSLTRKAHRRWPIKALTSWLKLAKSHCQFHGSTYDLSFQKFKLTLTSDPHPIFVIILVGKNETPFGIQKDLLCAQSPYFRDHFAKDGNADGLEALVKLPDFDADTFGCFQNFIYTGHVYDKRGGKIIPDYPMLMNIWKLAARLRMASLRVAVLDAMAERRQLTSLIPGAPLLIQAWKDTEEGSGLRNMLINWAAEHSMSPFFEVVWISVSTISLGSC